MKDQTFGSGSLSLALIGRNLGEGEKGMGGGGNRMKEQTEANVQVPKQVWEKQVNPFGFPGKVRPDSERRSLCSMPETMKGAMKVVEQENAFKAFVSRKMNRMLSQEQ